jgi:histidine ammonia-lyase
MILLDGNHLKIHTLVAVARDHAEVNISAEGSENIRRSRGFLEKILQSGQPVYVINTGFGIFARQPISAEDSHRLSRNLILSHAVGTGAALPEEVTRAAMLVRANTLVKGYSGVRLEIVQTLVDMLNKGVTPVVPEQGSLGSSGDLSPLSHLALVFTTDPDDRLEDSGWASYQGRIMRGKEAMTSAGIPRLILEPKEGLAVTNGATFSAAIAALAAADARRLTAVAGQALALTMEAILGCSNAYDPRLHQARGQRGQIQAAEKVRELLEGSTFIDAACRVQDAYSLRCAPQVHGAVLDTLDFVEAIIQNEINAATDNPLIFAPGEALSGGNFHGEPVGMAMDFLGIALAELGAISERRIFRLTDGNLNGNLPPMLVDSHEAAGLNSGLMMPQYTAASLVLENQTLAHPDSVNSLPTSGEQEDHNANAMTAARHARQIAANVRHILAIELYTAARAIDLRKRQLLEAKLGRGTQKVYDQIREAVPYQPGDALWGAEIDVVRGLIESGELDAF